MKIVINTVAKYFSKIWTQIQLEYIRVAVSQYVFCYCSLQLLVIIN